MTEDLYIKFLNNECTTEELKLIIQWIKSEALGEESKKWGFENWKSFDEGNIPGNDKKFIELFDKIQNKIDKESDKERKFQNRKSGWFTWMTRAAAILFVPLLSFFLYTVSQKDFLSTEYTQLSVDSMEVISPVGSRTVLQLSDGTEVHLNYGSKLKYPQTFTGDTREVTLVGEGYFDVAHNPDKPFIVKTKKLNIKVLGTEFNVLGYTDVDVVQTTLVKGKVVLEKKLPEGQNKTLGTLVPGQHVSYNTQTGNIKSTKGNVEKYIAWKEGKMVFDETPITEVAQQLKRKYNVDIQVKDDIKDYTYTVTFLDEPLMQILDLMTIATPVNYKVLPRKKLPDGTFSKQKIIIKRKDE
ncbi:FecR family protein [Tangfeifania diversioriginum]|nr:FecR family protein [Tangfeifania diversioriginum]